MTSVILIVMLLVSVCGASLFIGLGGAALMIRPKNSEDRRLAVLILPGVILFAVALIIWANFNQPSS